MSHRCLADINGPFFDPEKPFRNWSAFPFYQMDLPQAPYVDRAHLAWGLERATAQLARLHAQGYTGIVIDNLAHLVSFQDAPEPIYAPDSPYARRAEIYQSAFGALCAAAADLGMEVFVTADMQWTTPPIRRYVGRLTPGNPRLDAVNRWALEELFARLPAVSGLVVRVGEAGGAHDQGEDYRGHMIYTAPESLRGLIETLLPVCERHKRLLVMRTWSIGIGELGDLIWSPERYREVFGGYDTPNLLVSIKHGPADFMRLLPHNPTLGLPGPAQLIELQNRREYELFGMVPSSVAALHQAVLRQAQAGNRRFAGIWAWNSTGGWGGGRAVLGAEGWSFWTELNSALTAALLHDPDLDADAFVRAWCNERLAGAFGDAVADLYLESAELIERGWYMGRLRHGEATLGSIYLAPLLWVWWMRPTASLLIWAYLARAVADPAAALEAGQASCERLAYHAARLASLAPANCPQALALVESARYFHDALVVAQAIRALLLPAFQAAWQGRRDHWAAIGTQAAQCRVVVQRHCATWAGRADLPPLELDEIEGFLAACTRSPSAIWRRARLACLLVAHAGAPQARGQRLRLAGVSAVGILLLALSLRRWRGVGMLGVLASLLLTMPARRHLLRAVAPRLNRKLYLLPSIFFEAGPSFTEWTA